MKTLKDFITEAYNLSTVEGVHNHSVDKLSQAFIRHGVHKNNYGDRVINNPRKKAALDKIEDGIVKHIHALPDLSKTRDSNGNKESEELMNKIRHQALVNSSKHLDQRA